MRKNLPKSQLLGKLGEDYACTYLQSHGYHILLRNYRVRYGEIDIIAQKHETLIFVEVKTRSTVLFGFPEEAVTQKKLHELIRTAQWYLIEHPDAPKKQQIDVLAIEVDTHQNITALRHLQNVTESL
jgi:putative endonuclease